MRRPDSYFGLIFFCMAVIFTLLSSSFCGNAQASLIYTPNTYGLTTRGFTLAGALTGDRHDLSVGYYNPGAAALIPGTNTGLSYIYSMPYLFGGYVDGTKITQRDNNKLVSLTVAFNLRDLFAKRLPLPPLGFSFNVAGDDNFSTLMIFDDMPTYQGDFTRYGLGNVSMQGAIGVGIFPWLSVGFGFHGGFRGYGSVQTRADLLGDTANEGTRMRGAFTARPLGGLYFHGDIWGIGIVYRAETHGAFAPIKVDAQPSISGLDVDALDLSFDFLDTYAARQLAVGFSFDLIPSRLTLLADGTWRQWSQYQELASNPRYASADAKFRTRDIVTPKVGIEHRISEDVMLRAGYRFEQTPFDTIGTRFIGLGEKIHGKVILDSDTHVAAIGGGLIFDERTFLDGDINLDVGYQGHFMEPRRTQTSDGFVYEMRGTVHVLSASVSLHFD